MLAGVEHAIAAGGEIVNSQDWGVRQTAYEIGHKTDAEYHLLQFHGTREVLETLQRTLRITDGVVRFRIIKLAPGTPAPPATRPEPRPTGIGEPVAAEATGARRGTGRRRRISPPPPRRPDRGRPRPRR